MNLTPAQRETVRLRCGGRCAYCGNGLPAKWHADHVQAVRRQGYWSGGTYVSTGVMTHPQRDTLDNLLPACVPCNIDKSDSSLEAWRKRLQASTEVLRRNYSTYRHALRFGLIAEAPPVVRFYFEELRAVPKRREPT